MRVVPLGASVLALALGCGSPAPGAELSPVPAETAPAAANPIVLPRPVRVDLSGGPLVYRAEWSSTPDDEGRAGFAAFDEPIVVDTGPDGRVIRGRCGPYPESDDEGCVALLFPEHPSLGREEAVVEWRGADPHAGIHLSGRAHVEGVEEGALAIVATTHHRYGSLMGGTAETRARYLADEGYYERVEHEMTLEVHGLNPTGADASQQNRGVLRLIFDPEATAAPRANL
ncbi:MAG: hypothetical protein R3B82_00080 [Sandaracinaceae bacterium]